MKSWFWGLSIMGLFGLFSSCSSSELNEVRVLDADFDQIQVINDKEELKAFLALWGARKEVNLEQRPKFAYKIDLILQDGDSSRWLYAPEGYVALLTKSHTPIYEIEDPQTIARRLIPTTGTQ